MSSAPPVQQLILASQSVARKNMLQNVGLNFESMPADIDEQSIMDNMRAEGTAISEIASALAREKSLKISRNHLEAIVIGSDQVLEFKGEILTKAETPQNAREKINMLRGNTHTLISAVAVTRGDDVLWQTVDEATLTMHDFDDAALDQYCAQAGVALTRSVGAYEIENHGAWLFSSVRGDYFTTMGMPLLPLLSYLQNEHGFGPAEKSGETPGETQ